MRGFEPSTFLNLVVRHVRGLAPKILANHGYPIVADTRNSAQLLITHTHEIKPLAERLHRRGMEPLAERLIRQGVVPLAELPLRRGFEPLDAQIQFRIFTTPPPVVDTISGKLILIVFC